MKTIFSAFLFATFIALVISGNSPTDTGYLIRRLQSIQYVIESNIKQLNAQGNEQLTHTLQNQLKIAQAIDGKLKVPQNETMKHSIQEDILRLENRVMEELLAIEVAKHLNSQAKTAEILIKEAEELIKKTNEIIKQAPTHDRDYDSAKNEVVTLGETVKMLKTSPAPTGSDLKKAEIKLVKSEQTLKVLLDRLSAHSH